MEQQANNVDDRREEESGSKKYIEKEWKPFNLLGLLKIERKSDILAFVAFMLSIINAIIAFEWVSRSSDLELVQSDSVAFLGYLQYPTKSELSSVSDRVVHVIAPMTYINNGDEGKSDIVLLESVTVTIPGTKFSMNLEASEYVELDGSGRNLVLFSDRSKNALPFSLMGGKTVSHLSYFSPVQGLKKKNDLTFLTRENFVEMKEFTDALTEVFRSKYEQNKKLNKQQKQGMVVPVNLRFQAQLKSGSVEKSECTAYLNALFISRLANNNSVYQILTDGPSGEVTMGRGWVGLSCF